MKTISILFCFLAVASIAFIGILDNQTAYAGAGFSAQVTKTTTSGDGVFTFDLFGDSTLPGTPLDTCSIDTSTQSSCPLSSVLDDGYLVIERPQAGWMQDSTTCPGTIDPVKNPTIVCNFVNSPTMAVGGELIPLDTTMILTAGAQYTMAWMIPVIVSGIGIAIVIARKF